ncbi:hypothetical protein DPM19_06555 [Actinomadura craniellae]|uniref:Uncharacterized protein n=1 Tax=Actinomadura craniellae TaxID=2231787 RepID=A0A365HBV1_9ACTN|nr:hypothetical protein DPM19_06555 [Actinomadura craniellae]
MDHAEGGSPASDPVPSRSGSRVGAGAAGGADGAPRTLAGAVGGSDAAGGGCGALSGAAAAAVGFFAASLPACSAFSPFFAGSGFATPAAARAASAVSGRQAVQGLKPSSFASA